MTGGGKAGTLVWALGCLLAASIAARARYVTDISAFLPRAPSATQRLLVEQLREGPAARMIIAAIDGGSPQARARVSTAVSDALRAGGEFTLVSNGSPATLERDRRFLFEHRYVLSDAMAGEHFSSRGLHEAIGASIEALASPEGPLLKPLFRRDPTGELLHILDAGSRSAPHVEAGVWSSRDGTRALLLLQTRAAGSDTDALQRACGAVRSAFSQALLPLSPPERSTLHLLMSGPPVFAVTAREQIRHEALKLSLLSALLIALLLGSVYRSVPALVLGLIPVATGALAGIVAVALGFGAIHGITLGFGVTLIGESIDYSIYLFIQRSSDWRTTLWPTLRLGVLTSIAGFAALVPSSFPGLAQLGLYSIAGLICAALVTRYVLPAWLPGELAIRDLRPTGETLARVIDRLRRLRWLLVPIVLLATTSLYVHRGSLFSHELAALNPIPAADQALDQRLRAELGAPDVRYMVVVPAASRERALDAAAAVGTGLTGLVDAGVIGGFESPARYLPGLAVQQSRRGSIPAAALLAANLAQAVQGLPVDAQVLQPFLEDAEAARTGGPLGRAELQGTSFGALSDALLVKDGSGWSALLPISATDSGDLAASAVERIRTALSAGPQAASLLDLKGEADQLYAGYLRQAMQLSVAGFAIIVLLLLVALRSPGRVLRVLAPLVLAVITVAGILAGMGQQIGILHVVGMLLIVAVGSNYALFFDRKDAPSATALTLASLVVANLATVLAFGVLASSGVPVLADLGSTVAPGALLALVFSALLSRGTPAAMRRAA
ncbi:MAG: MMPL family transporter [Proteobacteria bacterium]|nr:MMPL family transporter [Pseudomonadota bacterium]